MHKSDQGQKNANTAHLHITQGSAYTIANNVYAISSMKREHCVVLPKGPHRLACTGRTEGN